MTPEKWAQLKDIFQQAVDMRPDARETFVASIRERDPSLAEELVSLLASQSSETGALDHPPAQLIKKALDETRTAVALQPGQVVEGRYEIVDLLGVGGFGRVYIALDRRVDKRKVVLKVVTPPANTEEWSERRFEDEVRSLARLDHPGIVRVYDSGRVPEGYRYLVMQYIAGQPLDELLKDGSLALPRALTLIQEIAEALGEAHAAGILHRDLKPANVIVRDAGQPNERAMLIDFGIARTGVDHGSEVHTSVMSGSPAYMAPEQFYGRTSPASDIFSLGSVAFEMLRGIPLHKCGSKEMMQETALLELAKTEPPVPDAVREAIAKALAPDPEQRFKSAREFGKALAEPRAASPSSPKMAEAIAETVVTVLPPPAPSLPRSSRSGWMWAVLGMVFTLALVYFGRGKEPQPPPRPSLEVHATLTRGAQPFTPGQALQRGDKLDMLWESPEAVYLYLFDDSAGEYTLLFPGVQSETPIKSTRQQIATDGLSPGESIVLVASKKPVEELESLRKYSQAPHPGELDAPGSQALEGVLKRVPPEQPAAGPELVWRSQGEVLAGRVKLN